MTPIPPALLISVNPPAPLVAITPVPVSVMLPAAVIEIVLPVSVTLFTVNAAVEVSVRLSLLDPPLLEVIVIPLAEIFTVCAVPESVVIFPPSASAPLDVMKIFPFAFAPSAVTVSVPPTVTSSGVTSDPIVPLVACSVMSLAPLLASVAPPTNDPPTTVTGSVNVTFDETVTTPLPLLRPITIPANPSFKAASCAAVKLNPPGTSVPRLIFALASVGSSVIAPLLSTVSAAPRLILVASSVIEPLPEATAVTSIVPDSRMLILPEPFALFAAFRLRAVTVPNVEAG